MNFVFSSVLFWSSLLFLVVILSFIFAYLSMRSYQVIPSVKLSYSLLLLSNPKLNLNSDLISKIYEFSHLKNAPISLERLQKDQEKVLAIYAPIGLKTYLSEYSIVEIEDYLVDERSELDNPVTSKALQINISDVLIWVIQPKSNIKKDLNIKSDFLKLISLASVQDFFWQIVIKGENDRNKSIFQTTIRAMVVDKNPVTRVELAKEIDRHITEATGLIRHTSKETVGELFESYKKRTLIPKERAPFYISFSELEQLLGFS